MSDIKSVLKDFKPTRARLVSPRSKFSESEWEDILDAHERGVTSKAIWEAAGKTRINLKNFASQVSRRLQLRRAARGG